MKTKFGAIIVDGRGKIGGHVASKNRSGSFLRTKVTPTNPQSTSQLDVRSRFSGLSSGWRGLTDAQRASWNAGVADFAKTDIFGDLKNPSGANLYQRINNNLLQIGEAALTDCPSVSAVTAIASLSAAIDVSDGTMLLTFAAAIAATHKVKLLASPAMSAGKSFVSSEYRQIDVLTNADVSPLDVAAAWEAKFGSFPSAGQKVFFKMVPVLVATGQTGNAIGASAIAVA